MSRSGLSADEVELNAIENIVLAETKAFAPFLTISLFGSFAGTP